ARRDERGERPRLLRRERRIQQTLGVRDIQIVRDVEDVRDDGAVDEARLEAQIHVAEWRGVRERRAWDRERGDGDKCTQNTRNTRKGPALRFLRVLRRSFLHGRQW